VSSHQGPPGDGTRPVVSPAGPATRSARVPRGCVAAALAVLGTCLAGPTAATATTATATTATADPTGGSGTRSPDPAEPSRVVERPLSDPRISEGSGLAVSPTHPGIVWTHNDSGNTGQLFAVGRSGKVVATLTVTGARGVDWEAVAVYRDSRGRAMLAVGDIGDNEGIRSQISVLLVPEPARLTSTTVAAQRVLRLTYPQGATDAEALLVDPGGRSMHVVTKGLFRARAYRVPAEVFGPDATGQVDTGTLLHVADTFLSLVTDGAVLPDGRVLLRNYGTLALMPPLGTAEVKDWQATGKLSLPDQPQGEGLAVLDGQDAVLVSSEGAGEPLLRVALPESWRQPRSTTGSGAPDPGSTDGTGAATGRTGSGGLPGRWGRLPGPVRIGAYLVGLAGAFLLVSFLLNGRPGRRDPGRGRAGRRRRRA